MTELGTGKSLTTLQNYMAIAKDYSKYLQDAETINALMASSPNSAFTTGWAATLLQAEAMGLNEGYEIGWNNNNDLGMIATNDNDSYFAADGADFIASHGGNDFVKVYAGNDTINGGAGNDTVMLGFGDDEVWAEGGNDMLDGGDGDDTMAVPAKLLATKPESAPAVAVLPPAIATPVATAAPP